ncbi:Molybdopterin-synthase adenylyltransferase [BD1-7 clade bacterium]|uniref:Molybdopterin-synthase adenylyltransferase n=1 Tax=BD1-7 clade bacterium TaxID=2029982 RepID=A0A5S9N5Z5_9GAMM|nr:Molybdopterin-synthase adenylyltransferase [BD1-7 clade bacterium]CAA0084703.1 Molybdopterin-synthase adenylyltransferase [BD1-7 clade bacterium]
MNDEQLLRYSRHIMLNGFDIEGQEALLNASVMIVGAGGLGCPAAMYLASAGVGRLVLVDHDHVDATNLQRQIGHGDDQVGRDKVDSLAMTLKSLNPDIDLVCLAERLTGDLATHWIPQVDVVLDCSDNFATRFLVNRIAWQAGVPLVSAAAVRAEGQLAVFDPRNAESPCYRCLYSEDAGDGAPNCSENGVLAPLVGIFGSMQALEAIKLISDYGQVTPGQLLVGDLFSFQWRQLRLSRDPDCPVCGKC